MEENIMNIKQSIKALVVTTALLSLGTTLPLEPMAPQLQHDVHAQTYQGREHVRNSFVSPYNTVVAIAFPSGGYASGFVVDKNKVLTNRHVLNSMLKYGLEKSTLKLAQNDFNAGTQKDLGHFHAVGYVEAPSDMDVVILYTAKSNGRDIGDVVNPARVKSGEYITPDWLKNHKSEVFHTAGYPSDKNPRGPQDMWYSDGQILDYTDGNIRIKFRSNIIGAAGISGSPLFDRNEQVVGIVNSGDNAQHTHGLIFRQQLRAFLNNHIPIQQ